MRGATSAHWKFKSIQERMQALWLPLLFFFSSFSIVHALESSVGLKNKELTLYVSTYLAYEPSCSLWIVLDCVLAAFDPSLLPLPVKLSILHCSTTAHQSEDHRQPLPVSLLRSNITFRVCTYHINYRLKCHPAHQYLKMIRKKSRGYTIPWVKWTWRVSIMTILIGLRVTFQI